MRRRSLTALFAAGLTVILATPMPAWAGVVGYLGVVPPLGDPGVGGGGALDPFVPTPAYYQGDGEGTGDAPNEPDEAWPIQAGGWISGSLAAVPMGAPVSEMADPADWYKVYLPARHRVTVTVQLPAGQGLPDDNEGMLPHTYLELRSPGGALAGHVSVSRSGASNQRVTFTAEAGWHPIELYPQYTGGDYQFRVDAEPFAGPLAVHAGSGYALLPFTIAPGGSVVAGGDVAAASWYSSHHVEYYWLLKRADDGSYAIVWEDQSTTGSLLLTGASLQLGEAGLGRPGGTGHWIPAWRTRSQWAPATEPGDYYLVVAGVGDSSYQMTRIEWSGPVTFGEPLSGGADRVHALRTPDFREGVGFSFGGYAAIPFFFGLRVGVGLKAAIDFDDYVLGVFDCTKEAQCSATHPDGTVDAFHNELLKLNHREPGRWWFARDVEVAAASDIPVLFVIDAQLP